MNERIKLLAEQAGLKWKAQPPHYTNTNNPIDFPVSANRDLEKFADLIVRECAETVQDFVDHRFPASEYPNRLKRYFGVER